ncbi:MAG: hypothetical protein NW217_11130 [Hyphomicrobiaceae bacterium]|nr:hypothetical protein [Hyphomicrobiaceae bacterium]
MTEPTCDACKLPPYPDEGPMDTVTGLRVGWSVRRISGRSFTLCDCCGNIRHFKGGVSTYLQEALGVSERAVCDFPDIPGGGLHRTRVRS